MRVIAGTARSLRLKTIEGLDTRPTTDRIKETLFNMLSPYVFEADFIDLFAGSGAIGIEALSRGANSCIFVELNPKAITCINDNVKFTKFTEKSRVQKADALSFIQGMPKIDCDVIFMDPPYGKLLERSILEILSTKEFARDTLIVVEAKNEEDFSYVEDLGFEIIKEKNYKTNKHVFINVDKTL